MLGIPTDKEFNSLYDAAMYCAQYRTDADHVMGELDYRNRIKLGIFGLFQRVRRIVNERNGVPVQAKKPSTGTNKALREKLHDTEGQLEEAKDRLGDHGESEQTKRHEEDLKRQRAWFQDDIAALNAEIDRLRALVVELGGDPGPSRLPAPQGAQALPAPEVETPEAPAPEAAATQEAAAEGPAPEETPAKRRRGRPRKDHAMAALKAPGVALPAEAPKAPKGKGGGDWRAKANQGVDAAPQGGRKSKGKGKVVANIPGVGPVTMLDD
jgi:hypothetical protein